MFLKLTFPVVGLACALLLVSSATTAQVLPLPDDEAAPDPFLPALLMLPGGCSRPSGDVAVQADPHGNSWTCESCYGHIIIQVSPGSNTVDCPNGCTGNIVVQVSGENSNACSAQAGLLRAEGQEAREASTAASCVGQVGLLCWLVEHAECRLAPRVCPEGSCPGLPPENYYCGLWPAALDAILTGPASTAAADQQGPEPPGCENPPCYSAVPCPRPGPPGGLGGIVEGVLFGMCLQFNDWVFILIYYPPGVYQVGCFTGLYCPCPHCDGANQVHALRTDP